nr:MAG TPA: hypothetical protein [Caudoviricetes sp.]
MHAIGFCGQTENVYCFRLTHIQHNSFVLRQNLCRFHIVAYG